jgi:hypothetical protein
MSCYDFFEVWSGRKSALFSDDMLMAQAGIKMLIFDKYKGE